MKIENQTEKHKKTKQITAKSVKKLTIFKQFAQKWQNK